MTFDDIQNLINSGAITGPTVAVCNCVNSLATAAREKTGKIEGLVGKARDESDNEERVYFNSLDSSFLVVLAIASIMGIQLHNNLKTANPELWNELNTLINSKYFKTFISLPSDLTKIILSDVEDKASKGAPAILTNDGELYVSGDLMEAVFQSLQSAGAFNTGELVFTMPTPTEEPQIYTTASTERLTFEQFKQVADNYWQQHISNLRAMGAKSSTRAANILSNYSSFSAMFDALKIENPSIATGMENAKWWCLSTATWTAGNPVEAGIFYNTATRLEFKILPDFGGSWYAYSTNRTNYELQIHENMSWWTANEYNVFGIDNNQEKGIVSIGTISEEGDTPAGLNQEEGAVLPSSSDNSFTKWAASNLTNYYSDRLITGALATANIPAHNQNWFKINIPYSLGYDTNLDGDTESGEHGTVNQNDSITVSQKEENEAAGIDGTGTNTETIINIYNSEEGSEPATKDQEDSGNIELEDLPTDGWNAAGMTGIYAPSREQLQSIEAWLWSSAFLDNVGKYFQDPAEALIGLYKTYFPFSTTGSQEVVFGRVGSGISAGVTNRYHECSLGSIHVYRTFNNYMDYTGNASIYVPFCGFQSVDLKDIMEADIELVYRVEFLTGSGVAILMVTRDNMSAPLYIWQVNVFESVPVSSLNMMGTYTAGLNMIGSAVGGAVSGGSKGGIPGAIIGGIGGAAGQVGSLAQSQHVTQGGSLSGNAAFQGPKKAYLTIRYNKNASPSGYERFEGIGTDTISTIGSFRGFVKFRDVYLYGIAADSSVLEEIESKLKEGVYI